MLQIKNDTLESLGYYTNPCNEFNLSKDPTYLMAPNGFSLTELEIELVRANNGKFYSETDLAQKTDWFIQIPNEKEGVVMNHSFMLYRRAYKDAASEQLWRLAKENPRIHRVLQQRPRWGLDISMEYILADGTMFEILHWEYDSDQWEPIEDLRQQYEPKILSIDWEDGAKQMLKRKDEWHHLSWFPQSKYKCEYFGFVPENFGQVLWK
jgi:hypothetical protein